jgi:hypothetical protein
MIADSNWENQRLRFGKRQRLKRWEYWSAYVLYFPIAIYCILYLAIRYRGIFTITAANPAIEDGGMINESKKDILDVLKQQDDLAVPNFVFLSIEDSISDRQKLAEQALRSNALTFPVVFKPNAGQRGTGVVVVDDVDELKQKIEQMQEDHLLQEFCSGREVSVFYYRFPDASQGNIFSITIKTLPSVIGDGKSDLKKLILKDNRHVCMADFLFNLLGPKLNEIPEKGEEVILNKIGAHCKGSMFQDGTHYAGDEFRQRLDGMMGHESGLCFGRFDIMVQDYDDLRDGKGIKIIELNGVTSEATHIYDPNYSIFYAWKTLAQQWKIGYQIGAIQKSKGHPCSSIFKILKQILNYRKKVRSYSGVRQSFS